MTLLLSCLRCSHSWLRRNLTSEPKFCPRCHSPYWNRQRKAAQNNPLPRSRESLRVADSGNVGAADKP